MTAFVGVVTLCVALVGAVFAIVWATSKGELVDVTVEDDDVVVRPRGAAALWSLKREIRARRATVALVRVVDGADVPIGVRLPGTAVPGVLVAGSYGRGSERSFWLVRNRRGPKLVIDLHDQPYARLVLEVSAPDAVASRLLRTPGP
jgi:hypothetical protein